MQRMADKRKREERDCAEREDGRDGEGRIFIISIDGAFRSDDGADAADRGADRKQGAELWAQVEQTAEKRHETDGPDDFDDHEAEADCAELPDVAEEKARAEQNNSGLEPEFVGGHAGLEDFGEAEDVGDG